MTSILRSRSTTGIIALGVAVSVLGGCGLGGSSTKKLTATTTTVSKTKVTVPASVASTSFATIPVPVTTATTLAPGQTGTGGSIATTAPGGGQTANPGDKYIVKSGDVPARIATAMGVSVTALLDANGLTQKDFIKVGQALVIPAGGVMPAGGADPNGAPAGGGATPSATGLPTTTIAGAPVAGSSKYVIVAGDSWYGIAKKFGVSPDALLAINKATTATVIQAGQTVVIPGKVTTTTTVKK